MKAKIEIPKGGRKRTRTETIEKECNENHPFIKNTFSRKTSTLPTIEEVGSYINQDGYTFKKIMAGIFLRQIYILKSFPILTHEFLRSLKNLFLTHGVENISELGGGTGWFSQWLKKYEIPIESCIDNKSWEAYKKKHYLPIVQEGDAVQYVKNHPKIELFLLSWPYMDGLALEIWNIMNSRQYLLYIGEWEGGCTASEEFFEKIEGCEVQNKETKRMKQSFISFNGIYDKPYLFRKP